MAAASFPSSPGKLKTVRRCGLWGNSGVLPAVGLCTFVGAIWLVWRFDNLWPESGQLPGAWNNARRLVNITIVQSAVDSGAVCLDGSPPAYFLDRGTGKGVNNWVVFLEGGGWCSSDDSCLERSFTGLGSSRYMPHSSQMDGVLSSSPSVNPDFYNWNRVLIKYCDGGSFNGDVGEPKLLTIKPSSRHFKAFLLGCSAGGLASILHCDQYQALMPSETMVKCGSDAGFFIDIPDVSGVRTLRAFYERVVLLQNMVGNLPESCTSQRDKNQCIFPQYLIQDIRAPFFILNPAYDTWQFENVLLPSTADPEGTWDNCRKSLDYCSEAELKVVQGFRDDILKDLKPLMEHEKDGVFVDSCYLHCQSLSDYTWNGNGPKVGNKSIAEVVGGWFFERHSSKVIDCPFPCNPSC